MLLFLFEFLLRGVAAEVTLASGTDFQTAGKPNLADVCWMGDAIK
jgi:hypothetical protein